MDTPSDNLIAYSVAEVARRSSLSPATIYRRMDDGTLHSVKIAGRRLIPHDALKALILGEAA